MIDKYLLVAQMVKNLPSMRDTWVQSLGQEDPLEKEMATYSSILAWRIPWIEEPRGLQSMGWQRIWHDWVTNTSTIENIVFFEHLVGLIIIVKVKPLQSSVLTVLPAEYLS